MFILNILNLVYLFNIFSIFINLLTNILTDLLSFFCNNIIYTSWNYIINFKIIIPYILNIYYLFLVNLLYYLNFYNTIINILYYINLDTFFINNYCKYIYLKDYLYSLLRFPIQDMLALNKNINNLLVASCKTRRLDEFVLKNKSGFKYYIMSLEKIRFSLYHLIQFKQTNNIYIFFHMKKSNKLLYVFPYIWWSFFYYFLIIFIILSLFLYKFYISIYKKTMRSCLYVSNVSLWDTFSQTTLNNNFILYKKNYKFNNYYYNETVIDKGDLSNIDYRYVSDNDEKSDIKEDDTFRAYWAEEKEKHINYLYGLNQKRYKKFNYIKIYKKYIHLKD